MLPSLSVEINLYYFVIYFKNLHEEDKSDIALYCKNIFIKYFVSHLTRALTVERTTLESRKRGVTRM